MHEYNVNNAYSYTVPTSPPLALEFLLVLTYIQSVEFEPFKKLGFGKYK